MTELTDLCNFADDTTFHACDFSLKYLVNKIECKPSNIWFDCNYMKLNEDKCQLIVSGHKSEANLQKKCSDSH